MFQRLFTQRKALFVVLQFKESLHVLWSVTLRRHRNHELMSNAHLFSSAVASITLETYARNKTAEIFSPTSRELEKSKQKDQTKPIFEQVILLFPFVILSKQDLVTSKNNNRWNVILLKQALRACGENEMIA